MRWIGRAAPTLVATAALMLAGATVAAGPAHAARPVVAVTTPVLGSVVRQLVGDAAEVMVLMPNGADPHQWQPSARAVAAMMHATLVVVNGLGLETNLARVVAQVPRTVPVFAVGDHITPRHVRPGEAVSADDPDQAAGAVDPHLWTDPRTMQQWLAPLAGALATAGLDVRPNVPVAQAELAAIDAEARAVVDEIPAAQRVLVTGHESLGYFAERYGFRLVGAAIPSLSSQAGASARQLAALATAVRANGVRVVFAEAGNSRAALATVAQDTGARVVELDTHRLPADGTYRSFVLDIARTIAAALVAIEDIP